MVVVVVMFIKYYYNYLISFLFNHHQTQASSKMASNLARASSKMAAQLSLSAKFKAEGLLIKSNHVVSVNDVN